MGTIYPIGPTLKFLLDELLEAKGMQKKTLGMQTLFEGTAVGIMDLMRSESRNALFTDMIRRVEQDEARHAAFGVLTMRRVVKEAEPEQIAEMEDWAFSILEALNANQQLDMLKVLGPKYDIDPENMTRILLSLPNYAELNSMPFMHTVIPNLQRLGPHHRAHRGGLAQGGPDGRPARRAAEVRASARLLSRPLAAQGQPGAGEARRRARGVAFEVARQRRERPPRGLPAVAAGAARGLEHASS